MEIEVEMVRFGQIDLAREELAFELFALLAELVRGGVGAVVDYRLPVGRGQAAVDGFPGGEVVCFHVEILLHIIHSIPIGRVLLHLELELLDLQLDVLERLVVLEDTHALLQLSADLIKIFHALNLQGVDLLEHDLLLDLRLVDVVVQPLVHGFFGLAEPG